MTFKFKRFTLVALFAATSAVLTAGPAVVKSVALMADRKLEGRITEWQTLLPVTEEISVAAANNRDRLIVAIATSDASMKQRLLAAGVIVYLDPKGKKNKTFGVRVPPAAGATGGGGRFGNRGGPPPEPGADAPPPGRDGVGLPAVTYVEVMGPAEKERHIVDLAGHTGFEAVRRDNEGTLVIEVAIPLTVSDGIAFAAPVDPALKSVGLGLVTPDVPSLGRGQSGGDRRGGMGGGGMGSGGMGGGGMNRGGGMSGPPQGGGMAGGQGKELKVWTSLELASPTAESKGEVKR